MTRNGTARMVNGQLVSGDFFQTLGVKPVAGRVLEMSDDSPTAVPVAVLNYGFWQSAFGGSRGRSQGCGARYARKYAETLTARQVRKLVSRFASVWAVYCPRVSRLIVIHPVAKPATSLLWSFRLNDLESWRPNGTRGQVQHNQISCGFECHLENPPNQRETPFLDPPSKSSLQSYMIMIWTDCLRGEERLLK